MKKIMGLLLTITTVLALSGCDSEVITGNTNEEKQYTEQLMKQATDEIGMPNITEFYEKKMAKEIFEKRDDSSLICYVYNQNLDGKYVYVGKSMGYGLPYSTQYTNPETYLDDPYGSYDSGSVVVSQADPNGLYSADGLSATWLMMIDETTGENYIMYAEPTIVVTENKLPTRLIADWSLDGVNY